MTGRVKRYNSGWGFIQTEELDSDVFVYYTNIAGKGYRSLNEGDEVEFEVEDTDRGFQAINVQVLRSGFDRGGRYLAIPYKPAPPPATPRPYLREKVVTPAPRSSVATVVSESGTADMPVTSTPTPVIIPPSAIVDPLPEATRPIHGIRQPDYPARKVKKDKKGRT